MPPPMAGLPTLNGPGFAPVIFFTRFSCGWFATSLTWPSRAPPLPRSATHSLEDATAIGELYTRFIVPRILHIAPRSDPGVVVLPDEAVQRANLEDLDRFHNLVTNQGGQMALVFLPLRNEIPTLSNPADKALHAWSATNDVPLIDFTAAIAPHPAAEISLYDHTHFNTAGNAIIGEAILKGWPASFQR